VLSLPAAIIVALAVRIWIAPGYACASLIILPIAILIMARVWRHRLLTRLLCPECGRALRIRQRDLRIDDPLNFSCQDCDIIWDTGCHWGGGCIYTDREDETFLVKRE
jgi:hypothetical protein